MDKLTAVNAMLASISIAPTTTIDTGDMEVTSALTTLDRATTKILELGWWFNTDYRARLIPTADNFILLPTNTLQVRNVRERLEYIQREGRLYDPKRRTFEFEHPIIADIVYDIEFDAIPPVIAEYIKCTAMVEYFRNEDRDNAGLQMLLQDLAQAKYAADAEGVNQLGINAGHNRRNAALTGRMYQLEGVQFGYGYGCGYSGRHPHGYYY